MTLLYNKTVKRQILKGFCSGCCGSRNDEASDEAVILCDGEGCCREYHLGCTEPLLLEIPEGEFYCMDCDPVGTTRHLQEYFDSVSDQRSEFQTSREFVENLIQKHIMSDSTSATPTDSAVAGDADDHNEDMGGGSGSLVPESSSLKKKRRKVGISYEPPFSEISRIEELYNAAMTDDYSIGKKKDPVQKLSIQNVMPDDGESRSFIPTTDTYIDRDFFVGKICKIYCPKDNQYHTGRIINWRSALQPGIDPELSSKYFYGEGDIGYTEFLVRFAAGVDGRKKTLLQWLILEEHATAISIAVVLALKKKGKDLSGWQYGQLMLRSCIELIPVRHIVSKCDHFGLVSFFDLKTNIYLDLKTEASNLECEVIQNIRKARKADALQGTLDPTWDLLEGYAQAEIMEQERTKKWYRLYLQNQYHEKALTVIDEYSWDLLPNSDGEEIKKDNPQLDDDGNIMPKLCPCIQRGLDKQWVANQLPIVKTLDSMASMEIIKSPRGKIDYISLINEAHQRSR